MSLIERFNVMQTSNTLFNSQTKMYYAYVLLQVKRKPRIAQGKKPKRGAVIEMKELHSKSSAVHSSKS